MRPNPAGAVELGRGELALAVEAHGEDETGERWHGRRPPHDARRVGGVVLRRGSCWKYALEAIIKALLLYFLVHDNRLLSMLELY